MKKETITYYLCSRCDKKHSIEEDAMLCEQEHREQDAKDERRRGLSFEITREHLKLLKNMYVGWDDCEFGAPNIDPKRPYGNSDVINDIANALSIKKTNDTWNDKTQKYLSNLHDETKIVLQIVLATLSFKTGIYTRDDEYSIKWKKKKDDKKC